MAAHLKSQKVLAVTTITFNPLVFSYDGPHRFGEGDVVWVQGMPCKVMSVSVDIMETKDRGSKIVSKIARQHIEAELLVPPEVHVEGPPRVALSAERREGS